MRAVEITAADSFPHDAAGLCVACGLCLPHCPTYRLTQNEAESPRGRIALMRALASGELRADEHLTLHLDHCLTCRACERVCPSEVPYGRLIAAARLRLESEHTKRPLRSRALHSIVSALTRNRWRHVLARALRLYRLSGLQKLVRASALLGRGRLAALDAALTATPSTAAWQPLYPAVGAAHGDVALFTGCATELLERETLEAAIAVLTRLGYRVHVPADQACCGALHWHRGERAQARALMRRNLAAFSDAGFPAVVAVASGCSAMLHEYDSCITGGETLAAKVEDISRFLARLEWPAQAAVRPLRARIAVHDACLSRNALRAEQAPYALLRRIPEAEIVPLPENQLCCGAAGSYFLDHPDMARALREPKIRHIAALTPDFVVTTNTGCALHLRAGLREAGLDVEVLHPVALLARQLGTVAG
jgi:glycolate oxidase iron-sulfur subunit